MPWASTPSLSIHSSGNSLSVSIRSPGSEISEVSVSMAKAALTTAEYRWPELCPGHFAGAGYVLPKRRAS